MKPLSSGGWFGNRGNYIITLRDQEQTILWTLKQTFAIDATASSDHVTFHLEPELQRFKER